MSKLDGKTVAITGASRGIGEATARLFASEGANVALIARSKPAISAIADDIGPRALAVPCDISDYAAVDAAMQSIEEHFGPVDILINNAGVIDPIGDLKALDPEAWSQLIDINVKGVFYAMRRVVPTMVARGGGTVLTISSGAAHRPVEGWSAYCTSKAGAAMLTAMLDLEERANGIRAIGLSPGTVATRMQREIKASGINAVSQLDWSDHVPPDWPAQALLWMCSAEADAHLGEELQLRDEDFRRKIGVVA
ncbi:SDR family oxidoreductase [Celeribacter halophilus]|uniref:NADP-dependent 3-hydroxy acid dehydrogenase YdfG n=1 Tax=Celeribacter halophilus TaxID=576117 RepID=A0A1I3T3V5_9RHOB|nr:SDR family oxidoreductase [Celeribacter halophilus]PZX11990.1 NADP-dependent 3-hydroxy acid dehydrogenase YdfG [Celeribacter halophilus]SFJ64356.1 NADP-dependent 3-hydroxy acid dehydrogenase YdfG [Celeribacter halophilus]